ncbi:MAG: prephenate dehydrogenase/arogenate dehydrogenase family protein [Phycisphaeraceae bacterium]|nr:prephenate dehydrogenase/arogenate dehydrogenase family protein [Phycisphaeraceae bacterium]
MLKGVQTITIVGTGLLGGSIGLALKQGCPTFTGRIIGVGRRQSTLQQALDLGCIDEMSLDLPAVLPRTQLLILATPLGHFDALLRQIASHDHPNLTITDVGSTKAQVCQLAARILPAPSRFVGSHPMAGSEQHGPKFARPDLFAAKPCIVINEPGHQPHATELVKQLWSALGMRLLSMTAQEHDRAVALISHLPHAAAVLLVHLAMGDRALAVASTGFADTTRVAASDPAVWADIFSSNRQPVLEGLDRLADLIARFRTLLKNSDPLALQNFLAAASSARQQWAASARSGAAGDEQAK